MVTPEETDTENSVDAISASESTRVPQIAPSHTPNGSHRRREGAKAGLALAALGVVFGDIGTSPLYSLQTVFSANHNAVAPTEPDVYGVISLVFWTLMIIVCYAYTFLILRADNDGEGGILSLVALLRDRLAGHRKLVAVTTVMAIIGASLFYGDSVITPAISVMSAIEGLSVVNPSLRELVLPLSLMILTGLFVVQRFGTAVVGRMFGPVMFLWFGSLAALGLPKVLAHPQILAALSPHHALAFMIDSPGIAFIAMGAIVLTITGVEALYADMGHFGPTPIRLAWFLVVFPSLIICYMGMGAMILEDPATAVNPFFHLAPHWARIPLVVLATMATVIASQAVISGAFSVSRQAARANLLPRLNVKHTSKEEGGQIYIGSINWLLFVGVVLLIGIFQSSERLASAYGLAVTSTLLLEMSIFLMLAHFVWRTRWWKLALAVVLIVTLEIIFWLANIAKVFHGGWLPLAIGATIVTIMLTWRRGARIVNARRQDLEGPLSEFIDHLHENPVPRVPGMAVFPHPNKTTTPLAMRQNLEFNGALHKHVVIVSIINENVPHVRHVDRAVVDDLGYDDDGIFHIAYHVGFNDSQDVPKAIEWAKTKGLVFNDAPEGYRYFLSSLRLTRGPHSCMPKWQRTLFLWLYGQSARRTDVFHLPLERTVVMGGHLEV